MELLSEGLGAPHLRADFDGHPGTIARARDAAGAFLTSLARSTPPARERSRDDVLLVVSELVTNAVRHAPGPLTLCLTFVSGLIQVTVRDTSTDAPRPRRADLNSGTGGFGWSIVERVAERFQVRPLPDGKEIHAFLPW
ncbi:ATP-binding protein [Streptomyces sp. TRM43335]|uniref:ATP-binding protein n=1 Tax=Streptomyces taklimakanensis TaxID=2569853 RepID=A0A6G2BIE2_9ACTN|nr:ATP-binding protein [Streptomyces taklimakanensis]MTE21839.1 ATP-binding protein [Streptomyces taklimakanensis]